MTLTRGTRLGPYEVTALLGSGGMAEVYRAHDVRLGRDVAIKILPDTFAADPEAVARFEREAKTASALNHPHLVTIYDIGEADVDGQQRHYIAMELIHGDTLRYRLAHESRDELLRLLAGIADGLAKAHDAGVVHRDLKPENVMVSEDNFAKVVDFGLAKYVPQSGARSVDRLTAEGLTVGTLGYMAPEQLRGERTIDGRADIFAFGCILYEAIAKAPAFDGDTPIDAMHSVLYNEPPAVPDAAIDRIVRRCLAKDAASRYTSMREVATAVRNAIATPVRRPIPRRFWLATAAVIALAVGTSGAYVAMRNARPPAIESIAVLPFRNGTGNEELRFLSDGIAEDVVRNLGRVATLRVIASSSASRFRDTADPQRAAQELNVDAVLVGKLRMGAGMMMLDAELVKASDGTALWGKKYTRKLTDIVALEQDIARDVCDEVRLKLAPQRSRAPEPAAHQAYLRAKREIAKDTAPAMKKAIEYLDQAIELDPDYALPYAGLAQVYGRQTILGLVPTRDGVMQQTAVAQKALSLDETLPEVHWNLAQAAWLTGNYPEFDRRLARVLELNPNFAPAYAERANHLVLTKRYDEAEVSFQRARALDPLSPRVPNAYGIYLSAMRQYDRASTVLRNVTVQFPDDVNAYAFLSMVYSHTGRHADALAAMDHIGGEHNPNYALWRAYILAHAGRTAEARAVADRMDEAAKTRYIPTYYRAWLHAELGDRDEAFALLDQGYGEGDWRLRLLPTDPVFDRLRSDPRFTSLMKQHGTR